MLDTPTPGRAQTLNSFPQGTPPELIDAVRNALAQHGLSAFAMSREAAIAHEAGHAIVGSHEGLTIRRVTIFARMVPPFGEAWGGLCTDDGGTWTTGPATSADDDLRRARVVIAGLAGEAITGQDKPGSSLDELALSQLIIGHNAAVKLADPNMGDDAFSKFEQKLWHRKVWGVALAILHNNREPFQQLAAHLHQKEKIQGGKLRSILSQVKRLEP